MKKYLLILLFIVCQLPTAWSQSLVPGDFLGYAPGTHFTPHYKIVEYYQALAKAYPSQMRLQQYGTTNEGRPLLLAFISSSDNISRLEAIRLNNLRLAGMSRDKMAALENGPAIVWLSYNIHGNEASSSEAALMTAWELLNPSNPDLKDWLKNVVVILDPCMNPDGRDRYVNWYRSVAGIQPDPDPLSREHREPWPGGRSNHYYFDLNRDWAWQTQKESRERVAVYNQWLPQVHVDFHEQGFNEPYYFAPAAEPYHEIITDWQRTFQQKIGRSNARYFDNNGWLFFTKERFDLFYPSYGDTYPLYRGAIGMTFEQGGGRGAGEAVITETGDTLRLRDRMMHHFTTGLSTIETASQNAAQLIHAFKQYYDDARRGLPDTYKSYIVRRDAGDRLDSLQALLRRNQIDWSYLKAGRYTGVNFFSGNNESFNSTEGDIVINANQPNAHLIKVLFEKNPKLSDSATYDITAWALPFAYGLTTYGLNQYISNYGSAPVAEKPAPINSKGVGFAIPWTGLQAARCLSDLLQQGVKVRYAELPFAVDGRSFARGTLIVARADNKHLANALPDLIQKAGSGSGAQYAVISSGMVDKGFDLGSDKFRFIRQPRITLLSGEEVSSLSMGEIWHFMEAELHYPVRIVNTADLNQQVLESTDLIILPSGNYDLLNNQRKRQELQTWINNGGRLIAMEEAVQQMARSEWGIKMKTADAGQSETGKEDSNDNATAALKRYENREKEMLSSFIPGSIYKVQLDNSHPLAFGYEEGVYYSLKLDDHVYQWLGDEGWNVGVIRKEGAVAGFVGAKIKDRIQDGLIFGVQEMGKGQILYMADDPLFRDFWQNGKLLFCNAVYLAGQ